MKCNYCGADNKEESKFCSSCGAELKENKKSTKKEEVKVEKVEVKEIKPEPVKTENSKDGKATASLVLGIVSLLVWCVTPITSIIGLILGICSKKSGKKVAGIILNSIALAASVICLLFCFWFGAVITTAIEEVGESGDFDRFFEIIEEEIEKQEGNNGGSYITPTIPSTPATPEKEDTKVVGTDYYGYVSVPNNWIVFKDVDNSNVYQYTDIGEYGYIVTLNTYEEDISALQAATNLQNKMKEEGAEVSLKTAIVGSKYVAWVVDAKYSDNSYIDIYLFKANDKLHYVAIEGPDDTNENFSIPKTFSLTK